MANKSIIDRVLLLAAAVCAAGLVWQLTVLLNSKGKNPAAHGIEVTASASAATNHPSVLTADQPRAKPDIPAVRVVYPDVAPSKTTTKITDSVPPPANPGPAPAVAAAAPASTPTASNTLSASNAPPAPSVIPVAMVSPALPQASTPAPMAFGAPAASANSDDGVKSQPAPDRVASVDPVVTPAAAADPKPSDSQGVDINRASIASLNRLRGGGRIGQAIASHRPYKSVQDLMKKRVLRRDVFDRIRGQIAAQ